MPQSRRRYCVCRSATALPFTVLLVSASAIAVLGGLDAEPVEKAGIDQHAVARIGLLADGEARRIGIRRQHHRDDGETLVAGEFEVALIVRRTAEDGARAVLHHDEIGD